MRIAPSLRGPTAIKRLVAWACLVYCGLWCWEKLARATYRIDLFICYQAASRLVHKEPVYRPSDHWIHTKAPLGTLLFVPLTPIRFSDLSHLWDALNLAVWLGAALWFARRFVSGATSERGASSLADDSPWITPGFVAVLGLALSLPYFAIELELGQYNLIGLGIAILACRTRNSYGSAVLSTAMSCLKPTNVLLLPWIVFSRRHKAQLVLGIAATLCVLAALHAVFFNASAGSPWRSSSGSPSCRSSTRGTFASARTTASRG
jgi:hypothetical protein